MSEPAPLRSECRMQTPSVAPCATVDAAGRIVDADAPFVSLLADGSADLIGTTLASLGRTPDDADGIEECLRAATATRSCTHVVVRVRTPGGHDLDTRLVLTPTADDRLTVVVIDETDHRDSEREVARLQRHWLALLRGSTDIVFTADESGTLTSVTSSLSERLGWAVEDVVGRNGLSFVAEDDRCRTHQVWLDVVSGRRTGAAFETRLIHPGGGTSWARVVIRDLRGDPDVRSMVGNLTDITEQREQDRRLREEEMRFRARFDQSPLPQVVQSLEGTYLAVNDAFCALVGRDREALIDTAAASITHPDDPGDAERVLAALRHGATEWAQVDRLLTDADGQPVPVRIDATLLRDADGQPNGCAAALQDLRPLRDSEQARSRLQSTFDIVASRSRDFITLFDAEGRNVYASPAGLEMFGADYLGSLTDPWASVHPDDRAEVSRNWTQAMSQRASHSWRYRIRRPSGEWMWAEQTSTNLLDTEAAVVVTTIRDVTAHVEAANALRDSEARYRAIADTAEEGIIVIGPDGVVTYANTQFSVMLGLPPGDLTGTAAWSMFDEAGAREVARRVKERALRGPERYELAYKHPDGTARALWVAASPMPDVDGVPQGSLAMVSDITEQRRSERELRHAAEHDELTGLVNRTMLMEHLASPDAPGTAVLFIDLDHFKDVNDGRGHTAGDGVLLQVADRLRSVVRSEDLVARFGGDEFVVVLHETTEEAASATAHRLLDVLAKTYRIDHHRIRIGATIGIAMSPAPSAEDLLRFADTAMYAAKASGRGRARMFDTALAEQAEERYTLGADLLTALADDSFEMHYQPVVDISTGEVAGVEALARWQHPTRGEVAPSRFIALAEQSGIAAELDRWVIRRALRDVAELKGDWTMPERATLAVNLSGQSLMEGLDTYIIEAVEEAGLDPAGITWEITESAIMADKDVAIDVLQRLRDHGFGIAIDDFGTGYSSMAYLRDLPITELKIDRGFVHGIPHDAHSLAIVTTLIELAGSLDLVVVAEGVETAEHLDALRARRCPLAQGWLWGAAMSPAELRATGALDQRFDTDGTTAASS
ncbi:EAL domain-containing protein [Aeromicrobium sp. S22]|nr:EAL domain-containing protein [Aeromicrobium sp. S22]